MSKILTPNRIALISGILLAIAGFIATLQTSLVPGSTGAEAAAKAAGIIATVLTVWRLLETFLKGSQNWDSLMVAGVPKETGVTAPTKALVPELIVDEPDPPYREQGGTIYQPPPQSVPPTLYDREGNPPQ